MNKTAPKNLLNRRSCKKHRKRLCIALKRKLRAAQAAPALPYIKVELYVEQAKEVSVFRYYNHESTGYAICPNCGNAMEREYQNHCEQCGQLLGWKRFRRNEITVQRVTGTQSTQGDALHCP